MTRIGGVLGGRELDPGDGFERAVERGLGEKLRASTELCERLWGSLANVTWRHEGGEEASYTFRAAGDLIAAVVGSGNYLDWYCSADAGVVDDEVRLAMAAQGWQPESVHFAKTKREL